MTTTIAKHFTFDAAHWLPSVPEHHKCHRMHGHTYRVELRFTGRIDAAGFCGGIDYSDIGAVWSRIHERVDHRVLNEIAGLEIPTTEVLAWWIAREFVDRCGMEHRKLAARLSGVRVSESSTTWCDVSISQAWRIRR